MDAQEMSLEVAERLHPERKAIAILNGLRAEMTDSAAWNTLFDAACFLVVPDDYTRAYGSGTLADRHGED